MPVSQSHAIQAGGLQPRPWPQPAVNRRFYRIMSILLTVITVFGFAHTVPSDFAPPGLPVMLQLHAAIFAAWVLLFLAQPAFIANKSYATHRRVGWVGAGLAAAMVALGAAAIMFALWNNTLPPFYPRGLFIMRGFLGLAVFTGLITAAIVLRRHRDWHKRLILCAAIVIIVPGMERAMPLPLFGNAWPYVVDAVIDLIALAGPTLDLIVSRRIHPAYLWGVGAILLLQAVVDITSPSPLAQSLLHAVGAG